MDRYVPSETCEQAPVEALQATDHLRWNLQRRDPEVPTGAAHRRHAADPLASGTKLTATAAPEG